MQTVSASALFTNLRLPCSLPPLVTACFIINRHKGEVDFLIDDYNNLTVVPIEVKSGKDYTTHSALNSLLNNAHSRIRMGIVLSNSGEIKRDGKILYLPVYMAMLLKLSGEEPKKITL